MRGAAIGLHKAHREIDGGMVGHVEKKNLCRADQQRSFNARRIRWHAALEKRAEHVAQCAKPS